jgi:hypothetical protein
MITTTKADGTTTENFVQYRVSGDTAEYHGPAATDIVTDSIMVKSLAPKRGNGQYGNRRSTVSLLRSSNVLDLNGQSVSRNRKVSIEESLPVGTVLAELIEDAAALGSLLMNAQFVEDVLFNGKIEV